MGFKSIISAALTAVVLASSSPAMAADEKILVLSGPLFDPFFGALKLGADDAARDLGVEFEWLSISDPSNVVPDFARVLQLAVSRKPDAILTAAFFPDALNPIIRDGAKQGIPIFLHNSGADFWQDLGAKGFVGEDAHMMGEAAGKEAIAAGVKNGICVNAVPGNPVLEARCDGYISVLAANGGVGDMLTIPIQDGNNPTAVTNAVKGVLQSNKEIDGIFTLGSTLATSAYSAIEDLGRTGTINLGTTDLSTDVLNNVKAGTIAYAIDQQPYLQGYYSVQMAVQYLRLGVRPVGNIVTGPNVIKADDVDAVLKANADFPGSRGAK